MFKVLIAFSILTAMVFAEPGVVVASVPVHTGTTLHHHGEHAVHSHVVHHPAPAVKHVVPVVPVHVVKPVVPLAVPVVKPVIPLIHAHPVVHHAHPVVIPHH